MHKLQLALAHSGTSIPYMDITITTEPGGRRRITTQLYDKRKHPPLSGVFIIKYPHMSSKISETAKYSIVTSQFHRLRRIVLQRRNFVDNMADILHTLVHKGYDMEGMLGKAHCGFQDFHHRQTAATISERRLRQTWSRVPVCFHLSACAWTLCMPYLLMVPRRRAQGCFCLFFFRYNTFHHLHIGCLCVHHS